MLPVVDVEDPPEVAFGINIPASSNADMVECPLIVSTKLPVVIPDRFPAIRPHPEQPQLACFPHS